jgi:hypothetical protein
VSEHIERGIHRADDRRRQLTREWLAVQACQGRIVDTATPEERAAREVAVAEECRRLWEAEQGAVAEAEKAKPPGLPAVASFES